MFPLVLSAIACLTIAPARAQPSGNVGAGSEFHLGRSFPHLWNFRIISNTTDLKTFSFELEDAPSLLSRADVLGPQNQNYVQWARSKTDTDPYFLLTRQRDKQVEFGFDTHNHDIVLDREAGGITSINKLEAILFEFHFRHYDFTKPVEFGAYVLRQGNRLKVYYVSEGKDSVPFDPSREKLQDQDIAAGWKPVADMHNHPFFFDNPTGDIGGTTLPSYGDIRYYRERRLSRPWQIWVSNGISSFKMDVQESGHFSGDLDAPRSPMQGKDHSFPALSRIETGVVAWDGKSLGRDNPAGLLTESPGVPQEKIEHTASRAGTSLRPTKETRSPSPDDSSENMRRFQIRRRMSDLYSVSCSMEIDPQLLNRYPRLAQLCDTFALVAKESLEWSKLDGNPDTLSVKFVAGPNRLATGEPSDIIVAYYLDGKIDIHPSELSRQPVVWAAALHEMGHAIFDFMIKHSPSLRTARQNEFLESAMQDFLADLLALYMTKDPMLVVKTLGSAFPSKQIKFRLLSADVGLEDIPKFLALPPNFHAQYYLSPLHRIVYQLYEKDPTLRGFGRVVGIFLNNLKTLSLRYDGKGLDNLKACTAINRRLAGALTVSGQ